jgi:hypothetical protein
MFGGDEKTSPEIVEADRSGGLRRILTIRLAEVSANSRRRMFRGTVYREKFGGGEADYFFLRAVSSSKYSSRLMRAALILDLMISTSTLVYVGIITGRAQPSLTYDL